MAGLFGGVPNIAQAGVAIVPNINPAQFRNTLVTSLTGSIGPATAALGGAIAAGITAAIGTAVKAGTAFSSFEESLTKITTLVGIASDETAVFGEKILALAPSVGRGPQELAEALFFITSAGLRGSEAMEALESSARAAALGLGETKDVADAVTSAMNAYGSDVLSASLATDILAAGVRAGKFEADALAGSIGRILPIASEMGVSFDQVVAAVAALSRTGLDANEGITSVGAALRTILNPSAQAKEALDEVGLSQAELMRMLQSDGLLVTLTALAEALRDNGAAATDVFSNARALTGVLALTGRQAEETAVTFEAVAAAAGLIEDATRDLEGTTAFRRSQAQAAIQAALIGEGVASAEAITKAYEDLADVLPELIPQLIEVGQLFLEIGSGITGLIGPTNEINKEFSDLSSLLTTGGLRALPDLAEMIFGDDTTRSQRIAGAVQTLDIMGLITRTTIGFINQLRGIPPVELTPFTGMDADAVAQYQAFIDAIDAVPPAMGGVDVSVSAAVASLGTYGGVVAGLRGPDGSVVVGFDTLREAVEKVATEAGNASSALLELTSPGFAAIAALDRFTDAYDEAIKDKTITDEERRGLLQPFLELQARVDELDPAAALIFRDVVSEAWTELGGDATALFGEGGVLPLAIDDFGNVIGSAGPILADNISGWGPYLEEGIAGAFNIKSFAHLLAGRVIAEVGQAEGIIRNHFEIRSPSRRWERLIGAPLASGILAGFEGTIGARLEAMATAAINAAGRAAQAALPAAGTGTTTGPSSGPRGAWEHPGGMVFNTNIYNPTGTPAPDSLQDAGTRAAVTLQLARVVT